MRYEFAKLHEQFKTTMVYVTHDQVEAMTLADRIVVLQAGVHRTGRRADGTVRTPLQPVRGRLHRQPGNERHRGHAGTGQRQRGHRAPARRRNHPLCGGCIGRQAPGDQVQLGVRPEHLRAGVSDNALQTKVTFVESLGSMTYAYCSNAGVDDVVTAAVEGDRRVDDGQPLPLGVPAGEDLPLQRARPRFPAPRGGRTSACGLNAARWRC
jgi:multiple sugar transport system ATP-binding protein